jgi:hypothetical protein
MAMLNTTNNAKDGGGYFKDMISSTKDSVSSVSSSYQGISFAGQVGVLIVIILILLVVIYLIMSWYSYSTSGNELIPGGKVIHMGELQVNEVYKVENDKDHNYSLSFWIYTEGTTAGTTKIIGRLPASDKVEASSGQVLQTTGAFKDNGYENDYGDLINKGLGTSYVADASTSQVDYANNGVLMMRGNDLVIAFRNKTIKGSNKEYVYLSYDFLPLTLWNHIVITVEGSHIVLYLNGELYKAVNLGSLGGTGEGVLNTNFDYVILGNKSDNVNRAGDSGLNGTYVTKFMYVDKEIGIKHVQKLYAASPYGTGLLAKWGLGFQSPVYFMDFEDKSK